MTNQRMDTIPGMSRMMIGVACSVGKKAILTSTLTSQEAERTISALTITITAYEQLVCTGRVGPLEALLKGLEPAEQADYAQAKHYRRALQGVYGAQPKQTRQLMSTEPLR